MKRTEEKLNRLAELASELKEETKVDIDKLEKELDNAESQAEKDAKFLTRFYEPHKGDDNPFERVVDAVDLFITNGDLSFGGCVPQEYRVIVKALLKYKMNKITEQIN